MKKDMMHAYKYVPYYHQQWQKAKERDEKEATKELEQLEYINEA